MKNNAKESMPFFSFVIPVYNVEAYLDECINSILSQTYQNFEIVLVNDGSSDSSPGICKRYAASDQRVKLIHQSNMGPSEARNTGIRNAVGKYIIFLDSDDLWDGDTSLNDIFSRLNETNDDVLIFNFRKKFDNESSAPYFSRTEPMGTVGIPDIIGADLWVSSPWNKVTKRELFEKNDLFFVPKITSEDIDWSLRLAVCASTFSYLPNSVLLYRQREASITHTASLKKTKCLLQNIRRCINISQQTDKARSDVLYPYISYQFGTLMFSLAVLEDTDGKKPLTAEAKTLSWLLKYSKNKKIRLLYICNKLFGFNGTLYLLKLKYGA